MEESMEPILSITTTIEQLRRAVERMDRSLSTFYKNSSLYKSVLVSPARSKRNLKFKRYYTRKAIGYLVDYRDLLVEINNIKKGLLNEDQTVDIQSNQMVHT